MLHLLLLILLVLSPDVVTHATTYYVSTTGNNSNNGLDPDTTPKRTVAHCVGIMVAGDTCFVRGGTYAESVIRFSRSGTQALPIKLLNYPGERPIIDFISPGNLDRILIQHASGINVAMGWITIQGFEIRGGHDGIKAHSLHNAEILNNWIHDNPNQGILGGGHHILIARNIISHNGDFVRCNAISQQPPPTSAFCAHQHGIYGGGTAIEIRNNIFYDNIGFAIQQDGSQTTYTPTKFPSPEFAGAANWVVSDNLFAYEFNSPGVTIWDRHADNARYENNIFYENVVNGSNIYANGFDFTGGGQSGNQLRNNYFYASGSGGLSAFATNATEGVEYTQSGNVVNTTVPPFVNGGSNALPASPDFRLTASSPLNMARSNEFPNNSTGVVGPFKTVGTPICSLTANKITCIFPMSTAVPIQNLSTAGVTVSCPVTVCPGTDVVNAVTRPSGTDSHVEITLSGITGNACVSHADPVTISYNSAIGTWTGNDNIGPWPGLHQKIFSFSNLPVSNQCSGSGPPDPPDPGGLILHYKFDASNGNDETANNNDCVPTNSPTWGVGKTGIGMVTANGTTQHCALPWGSGINPDNQDMTWTGGVFVPSGSENVQRFVLGPDLGTNQRAYIVGQDGNWRMSIQSVSAGNTPASNLAVTSGWNYLTAVWNSTTNTVTLHKDGVAGNGGAVRTFTSFTFASNLKLGLIGANTAKDGTYDEWRVYTSLENPAVLFAEFQASAPPPAVGTLAQTAVQIQAVHLVGGSPVNPVALNTAKSVVKRGAGAVVVQLHCQNIANCDPTAFKWTYKKNGGTTRIQIPNTETADGIWMYGQSTEDNLNAGVTTTRLTGSCAVTNGVTVLTADQIPNVDLPQDGCVMLRGIFNFGAALIAGDYFDISVQSENGLDLPGGYAAEARFTVIDSQASAGP